MVKRLFRLTNICIMTVTTLWVLAFILNLIDNDIVGRITAVLLVVSVPMLIAGIVSYMILLTTNNTIELKEGELKQLILNIKAEDFENEHYDEIRSRGNFIILENRTYEIDENEAFTMLNLAKPLGIEIKISEKNLKAYDYNPKNLLKASAWTLWGAS